MTLENPYKPAITDGDVRISTLEAKNPCPKNQFQIKRAKMRTIIFAMYLVGTVLFITGSVNAGITPYYSKNSVITIPIRTKRQLFPSLGRNIPSPGIPGFFNPLNSFGGSSTSSNANAIASSFGSSNGLSASNAASNAASHSFGGLGQSGFYPGFASSSAGSSANAITNSLDGFSGFSGSNAASNALSQNVGGFGISSSNANANAFSQGFNPDGFGSSAANAQAQSFQSDSPFGSFGASAANAASQGISFGSGGLSGSASQSGSQSYNLPGNRKISLSYSNGFSLANGAPSVSNGFSISQS
ncbi:secreted protein C-like isoform X2 [Anopheles albimanus]|uniref:secreted protein C-like isoform X2 n=1 Tax=Anopheles albimanus TaxID=7167 RepID=UPI00164141ED|nr:secreted protein C-like isoform X2 [Anopheles albimanus]